MTSLAAALPFLGAFILARSDVHSGWQKIALGTVSVLLGVLVIAGATWAARSLADPRMDFSARIESDVEAIAAYVRSYRERRGELPSAEAWQASVDSGDPRLFDPWRRPYRYEARGSRFSVGTLGRDGKPGGEGADADTSIELE